ncbi:MAG TPA: hypothetical protein VMF61_01030 [Candidatus Acidoferrales bacterium]|nr:hypothetical protein [Candidatus Acidoferrales bacterium]
MAVNVADYITRLQDETLRTIKESQDANLNAIAEFRKMGKEFAEKPNAMPSFENVPTPTQFVEMSFNWASRMLELRKGYTLKIAEMLVETQKQVEGTVQAAANAATPNGATANGTVPGPAVKTVAK